MKKKLTIEVVPVPTEEAHQAMEGMLGVLADALAERLIARARAAVARELGVEASELERETHRDAPDVGLDFGLSAFMEAS